MLMSTECARVWKVFIACVACSSSSLTFGNCSFTNLRLLAASAELRSTFWRTYSALIWSSNWVASTGSALR